MEYITTPEAAELNAAARMRELGYPDARVTGRGADGGVDVVFDRAVAQVKQESYQTGRPALQRLYGARGEDRSRDLLFFSAKMGNVLSTGACRVFPAGGGLRRHRGYRPVHL